jgi:hypothetical protein
MKLTPIRYETRLEDLKSSYFMIQEPKSAFKIKFTIEIGSIQLYGFPFQLKIQEQKILSNEGLNGF